VVLFADDPEEDSRVLLAQGKITQLATAPAVREVVEQRGSRPQVSPSVAVIASKVTRGTWVRAVGLGQLPSITLTAQDEDFGVVDEPVGDGRGYGGRIEDFAPVRKG
jgi:hypothetical protein